FMILKIDNEEFINNISKNQTVELFNEYKTLPNIKIKDIKVLEQVNLMTPENIHLNSFMYEPILDMNSDELIKLYKIIKRMLEGSE
ncbi:FIG00831056: hypothetical protein, partial [bacterium endosymbiont of Bathymodiolus sp. 5 South]